LKTNILSPGWKRGGDVDHIMGKFSRAEKLLGANLPACRASGDQFHSFRTGCWALERPSFTRILRLKIYLEVSNTFELELELDL
jgi:hypothetical protein